MKNAVGLGFLVAVLFGAFVFFNDLIGASAFYMAAIAMAMFAVIGPFGDYFKTALSMLIGVVVALIGIFALAGFMPLPPNNIVFVALVSAGSLFFLILLSPLGLRIDAMFIGWAGYFAAIYGTYINDVTSLTAVALPTAVGVTVSLMVGLIMALLVMKIAIAVNR